MALESDLCQNRTSVDVVDFIPGLKKEVMEQVQNCDSQKEI